MKFGSLKFRSFFLFILAVLILKPYSKGETVDVDLGESGNSIVLSTFYKYQKEHPLGQCRSLSEESHGRRVILTGFGLFSNNSYNVSGTIVRSMASPTFWPTSMKLNLSVSVPSAVAISGIVESKDNGALVFNRSLEIDGTSYDICFMILDVVWDLAGALVLHEANNFKPELVMMMGRGESNTATFEAGALNYADNLSGYSSNGARHPDNVPRKPWIIEEYQLGHELAMVWDNARLVQSNRSLIETLGYMASAPVHGRRQNDYICNNLSFVVLHGIKHPVTKLAGKSLPIATSGLEKTQVGFLHLPAVDVLHPNLNDYSQGVFGWANVVASTIKQVLAE